MLAAPASVLLAVAPLLDGEAHFIQKVSFCTHHSAEGCRK